MKNNKQTPTLRIVAHLNPNEGGCDYSAHFKKTWVKNDKLHPFAKAIPLDIIRSSRIPEVILLANGNKVWHKKGNQINPANLQNFIIDTYVN